MKVCVHGLWHLGSVTAACLASVGHDVVGVELGRETAENQKIIDALQLGQAPILEPGLNELIAAAIKSGNLCFTSVVTDAVCDAEVLWVAVDTPVDDDDKADVDSVLEQIKVILPCLADNAIILVSSQMPVGSIRDLETFASEVLPNKAFSFACSPENLRLGNALDVFLNPDRIVVGVRDEKTKPKLEKLLLPVTDRIEWMAVESAEMTKHAINAFLATSVTFANEIASICEIVGADAKQVERGLKTESRIGPKAYLSPGGPFAGGTLARDIEFLGEACLTERLVTPLLSSVRLSNDEHKGWVRRKLLENFPELNHVVVAILGLTYKPGTDTLRRSLSVELCDWLIEKKAIIQVYDPVIDSLPTRWAGSVINMPSTIGAVKNADVLVVGTEWPEFRNEAESFLAKTKPDLVVIDANRHIQKQMESSALTYIAVGTQVVGKY